MKYRLKYYWEDGNVTFFTSTSRELFALARARQAAKYEKVTGVDVYQGTELIATFYK